MNAEEDVDSSGRRPTTDRGGHDEGGRGDSSTAAPGPDLPERPIPWTDDVEAAEWVVDGLDQRRNAVTIMVPSGYPAYARVRAGWHRDHEQARPLVDLLRRHSPAVGCDADRCSFGLATLYGWTGQGPDPSGGITLTPQEEALKNTDFDAFFNTLITDMAAGRRPPSPRAQQPPYPHRTLDTDIRSYMLYRGAVEDATRPGAVDDPVTVPDLWWPEDRTWFVGSDTDWPDLYLGGPTGLVDALHDDPLLTVVAVDPDEPLDPGPL